MLNEALERRLQALADPELRADRTLAVGRIYATAKSPTDSTAPSGRSSASWDGFAACGRRTTTVILTGEYPQ